MNSATRAIRSERGISIEKVARVLEIATLAGYGEDTLGTRLTCKSIAKTLLEYWALGNSSDNGPLRTRLHVAIELGLYKAVQGLLRVGADPNGLDEHGIPPLWYAVAAGYEPIVRLLLDAGASIQPPPPQIFRSHLELQPLTLKETLDRIRARRKEKQQIREFLKKQFTPEVRAQLIGLDERGMYGLLLQRIYLQRYMQDLFHPSVVGSNFGFVRKFQDQIAKKSMQLDKQIIHFPKPPPSPLVHLLESADLHYAVTDTSNGISHGLPQCPRQSMCDEENSSTISKWNNCARGIIGTCSNTHHAECRAGANDGFGPYRPTLLRMSLQQFTTENQRFHSSPEISRYSSYTPHTGASISGDQIDAFHEFHNPQRVQPPIRNQRYYFPSGLRTEEAETQHPFILHSTNSFESNASMIAGSVVEAPPRNRMNRPLFQSMRGMNGSRRGFRFVDNTYSFSNRIPTAYRRNTRVQRENRNHIRLQQLLPWEPLPRQASENFPNQPIGTAASVPNTEFGERVERTASAAKMTSLKPISKLRDKILASLSAPTAETYLAPILCVALSVDVPSPAIIRALLEAGADPLHVDSFGHNAVGYGCARGSWAAVETIFHWVASENKKIRSSYGEGTRTGNTISQLLVERFPMLGSIFRKMNSIQDKILCNILRQSLFIKMQFVRETVITPLLNYVLVLPQALFSVNRQDASFSTGAAQSVYHTLRRILCFSHRHEPKTLKVVETIHSPTSEASSHSFAASCNKVTSSGVHLFLYAFEKEIGCTLDKCLRILSHYSPGIPEWMYWIFGTLQSRLKRNNPGGITRLIQEIQNTHHEFVHNDGANQPQSSPARSDYMVKSQGSRSSSSDSPFLAESRANQNVEYHKDGEIKPNTKASRTLLRLASTDCTCCFGAIKHGHLGYMRFAIHSAYEFLNKWYFVPLSKGFKVVDDGAFVWTLVLVFFVIQVLGFPFLVSKLMLILKSAIHIMRQVGHVMFSEGTESDPSNLRTTSNPSTTMQSTQKTIYASCLTQTLGMYQLYQMQKSRGEASDYNENFYPAASPYTPTAISVDATITRRFLRSTQSPSIPSVSPTIARQPRPEAILYVNLARAWQLTTMHDVSLSYRALASLFRWFGHHTNENVASNVEWDENEAIYHFLRCKRTEAKKWPTFEVLSLDACLKRIGGIPWAPEALEDTCDRMRVVVPKAKYLAYIRNEDLPSTGKENPSIREARYDGTKGIMVSKTNAKVKSPIVSSDRHQDVAVKHAYLDALGEYSDHEGMSEWSTNSIGIYSAPRQNLAIDISMSQRRTGSKKNLILYRPTSPPRLRNIPPFGMDSCVSYAISRSYVAALRWLFLRILRHLSRLFNILQSIVSFVVTTSFTITTMFYIQIVRILKLIPYVPVMFIQIYGLLVILLRIASRGNWFPRTPTSLFNRRREKLRSLVRRNSYGNAIQSPPATPDSSMEVTFPIELLDFPTFQAYYREILELSVLGNEGSEDALIAPEANESDLFTLSRTNTEQSSISSLSSQNSTSVNQSDSIGWTYEEMSDGEVSPSRLRAQEFFQNHSGDYVSLSLESHQVQEASDTRHQGSHESTRSNDTNAWLLHSLDSDASSIVDSLETPSSAPAPILTSVASIGDTDFRRPLVHSPLGYSSRSFVAPYVSASEVLAADRHQPPNTLNAFGLLVAEGESSGTTNRLYQDVEHLRSNTRRSSLERRPLGYNSQLHRRNELTSRNAIQRTSEEGGVFCSSGNNGSDGAPRIGGEQEAGECSFESRPLSNKSVRNAHVNDSTFDSVESPNVLFHDDEYLPKYSLNALCPGRYHKRVSDAQKKRQNRLPRLRPDVNNVWGRNTIGLYAIEQMLPRTRYKQANATYGKIGLLRILVMDIVVLLALAFMGHYWNTALRHWSFVISDFSKELQRELQRFGHNSKSIQGSENIPCSAPLSIASGIYQALRNTQYVILERDPADVSSMAVNLIKSKVSNQALSSLAKPHRQENAGVGCYDATRPCLGMNAPVAEFRASMQQNSRDHAPIDTCTRHRKCHVDLDNVSLKAESVDSYSPGWVNNLGTVRDFQPLSRYLKANKTRKYGELTISPSPTAAPLPSELTTPVEPSCVLLLRDNTLPGTEVSTMSSAERNKVEMSGHENEFDKDEIHTSLRQNTHKTFHSLRQQLTSMEQSKDPSEIEKKQHDCMTMKLNDISREEVRYPSHSAAQSTIHLVPMHTDLVADKDTLQPATTSEIPEEFCSGDLCWQELDEIALSYESFEFGMMHSGLRSKSCAQVPRCNKLSHTDSQEHVTTPVYPFPFASESDMVNTRDSLCYTTIGGREGIVAGLISDVRKGADDYSSIPNPNVEHRPSWVTNVSDFFRAMKSMVLNTLEGNRYQLCAQQSIKPELAPWSSHVLCEVMKKLVEWFGGTNASLVPIERAEHENMEAFEGLNDCQAMHSQAGQCAVEDMCSHMWCNRHWKTGKYVGISPWKWRKFPWWAEKIRTISDSIAVKVLTMFRIPHQRNRKILDTYQSVILNRNGLSTVPSRSSLCSDQDPGYGDDPLSYSMQRDDDAYDEGLGNSFISLKKAQLPNYAGGPCDTKAGRVAATSRIAMKMANSDDSSDADFHESAVSMHSQTSDPKGIGINRVERKHMCELRPRITAHANGTDILNLSSEQNGIDFIPLYTNKNQGDLNCVFILSCEQSPCNFLELLRRWVTLLLLVPVSKTVYLLTWVLFHICWSTLAIAGSIASFYGIKHVIGF